MVLRKRNRATAKKMQPIAAISSICGQTISIQAPLYKTARIKIGAEIAAQNDSDQRQAAQNIHYVDNATQVLAPGCYAGLEGGIVLEYRSNNLYEELPC
jgi:hypothetical protein